MDRRARLEAWLNRRWYGRRPIWWLLPLSAVYLVLGTVRRLLTPRASIGVPVIVVGNLTAGGSGKTPVVLALVNALRDRGFTPGIVTRGYGARVPGIRVLRDGDSADAVGDEPALMAQRGVAPVAIGVDRVKAARALLAARPEVDVVISDDGLQHYRLARAVEIVVIDGTRVFGNGALIPAGPLRERTARLESVDVVLVNGSDARAYTPYRVVAGDAVPLSGLTPSRPLATFRGSRVHAVAGIGDPRRFFNMLARLGIFVNPHPFPDHHRYRAGDLEFDPLLPILMTEKDAVKCSAFAGPDRWFVPIRAELPLAVVDLVQQRLIAE
ncbi:MAG: tetraacyldisaccharide 4'-kinase [Gammaproteobacteria bacterium]